MNITFALRIGALVLLLLPFHVFPASTADLPKALVPNAGKVIYVDFWASWCTPCRRAMPWLNTMQARYGGEEFTVVGINLDEDQTAAEEFLKDNPVQYPVVFDSTGQLAEYFDILGMPSTIILLGDGTEVARHTGFVTDKILDYEKAIRLVLGIN